MANLFEKKKRHLLPNWRSFENTLRLGELNGSHGLILNSTFKPDISDLLDDWSLNQSIGVAGDIIGAAIVCNQQLNPTVINAANFIIQNSNIASNALIDSAKSIIAPRSESIKLIQDIDYQSTFDDQSTLKEIFIKINQIKKILSKNPLNPINWIEIGRYYSILGQEKKAERAVKNAYFLAPENRFILRSLARFFIHIGDFEFAHDAVRKSELTKFDPWLLATEISISTLRNRNSRFAKTGFQIIDSNQFHPFNITELSGALATLELKNSKIKNCKKLFQNSLISPNDNSLAQAEWASQFEKSLSPVNSLSFNIINSYEAQARDYFEKKQWEKSIEFADKWFFDIPFSKMSILFGSEIASRKLKDYKKTIEITRKGLISHPNDRLLLNNIIFSLCILNDTKEAFVYLNKLKREDFNTNDEIGVCLTATKGLYNFRIGKYDLGRYYYFEAIRRADELKNESLNSHAFINYVREEIIIGEKDLNDYIKKLELIVKKYKNEDISEEAQDVIDLYKMFNI